MKNEELKIKNAQRNLCVFLLVTSSNALISSGCVTPFYGISLLSVMVNKSNKKAASFMKQLFVNSVKEIILP
jgi:hypothetical protein